MNKHQSVTFNDCCSDAASVSAQAVAGDDTSTLLTMLLLTI